jgi:hypothetical protein
MEKPPFYYHKAWWTDETVLKILPGWNHHTDGDIVTVSVYTNCESIKLTLNGRVIAEQKVERFDAPVFEIPFERGVLAVEGIKDGVVYTDSVKTSGKIDGVKIEKVLSAVCDEDIEIYEIVAVDKDGIFNPSASEKLALPTDALRNSVEQVRRKQQKEQRSQESRDAQATIKHFGDRVNAEAAQNPRAVVAEEAVLGLLLHREEYRNAVEKGEIPVSSEDFVTEFNRRVFERVMAMHGSEAGFRFELLGMDFDPDAIGRIEAMEIARRQLLENGPEVFRSAVASLREVRKRDEAKVEDIHSHLAYLREKKAKLHKGKADTQ